MYLELLETTINIASYLTSLRNVLNSPRHKRVMMIDSNAVPNKLLSLINNYKVFIKFSYKCIKFIDCVMTTNYKLKSLSYVLN